VVVCELDGGISFFSLSRRLRSLSNSQPLAATSSANGCSEAKIGGGERSLLDSSWSFKKSE
jgi:hypothetical protein